MGFGIQMPNKRLRLARIDAPEIKGVERPRGLEARDFVRELCRQHKNVGVIESLKAEPGKHGRWLVELWVGGRNIATELLRAGLATIY